MIYERENLCHDHKEIQMKSKENISYLRKSSSHLNKKTTYTRKTDCIKTRPFFLYSYYITQQESEIQNKTDATTSCSYHVLE